ncbi:glycoside hydrolase family 38 C-terminal domain-containing protein [Dinghuibacter silviterrae]|uniref:Alpha-mannosidase n=1 Tax=Dinghuibacter silviterrae TaxID=1539049 RepID=A0A4R8DH98_9BACT|nr:glycoside hydrolase family 38 C-terminal domain-containing protein [Dinghuibacter silviterrae]TDW96330.1 alpha-mannosidase [Dinghuibacter silviterrae]
MKYLLTIWSLLLTAGAGVRAQDSAGACLAPRTTARPAPDAAARAAYFIDGYHGGIYGHLPPWQTRFMVDQLNAHPWWKINLELEPESWDTIEEKDPAAYADFEKMFADQSSDGRIEYINPAYGQSYLYNISGESIIRQFYYGIRKLRAHFPGAVFTTYSSEEPCFTSALPQILSSYGFKYASLKNPNTCWGGYTRAYGGELVNWIGPDGSRILAVPRYAVEALKPRSTWETIACNNSVAYITRAFAAGIAHPVGMCLQDAGWNNGPWIKPGAAAAGTAGAIATADVATPYMPTVFETWRGYIDRRTSGRTQDDWRFSQEDVLVSLVWGGQVLQRIARQVRASENKIVATEKLAAMAAVFGDEPWPGLSLDEAWRTLLLSQHHDCWIVPYNERGGLTWADHVTQWTGNTDRRCDSILERSMDALSGAPPVPPSATTPPVPSGATTPPAASGAGAPHEAPREQAVRVFNSTATAREECVAFPLPAGWKGATILDEHHYVVPSQAADTTGWLFRARVPSLGYATYFLKEGTGPSQKGATPSQKGATPGAKGPTPAGKGAQAFFQKDGTCRIETDLYSLVLDPAKGGAIKSLAAKRLHNKTFTAGPLGALRGNFYHLGGFHSSTETPAGIHILENGPLRVKVEVQGQIAGVPFTQYLTLAQGQRRIDVRLHIDWTDNMGIGESPDSVKGHLLQKAFYNDSFKLQAVFPLALSGQKVYKDAPFDVLRSRLTNTFFNSWDSIKNVVLLHWVDVTDGTGQYGMAVLSDHTTSYAHGPHDPLGLTVQYSGDGLFGRNYTLTGPSELGYALVPHEGTWDQADVASEEMKWEEPLRVSLAAGPGAASLLHTDAKGWQVTTLLMSGGDLEVRIFNASGDDNVHRVYTGFSSGEVQLIALDGHIIRTLTPGKDHTSIALAMPRFGIRTLKFIHVSKPSLQ